MNILLDKRLQNMIIDYVPEGEALESIVNFFSVFSDYTRIKMISALSISEMCVSDLSRLLKTNQTTISHQLRLLKTMNIVTFKRQGKVLLYSLKDERILEILLKSVEFLGY
ncbi:MAG: metalloregulator ArsR/SmtB family transcription factor [Clostridia bacterium]|nr:metalloregulator ArsR/SmtB family transcription factor [Clostridia bacterium]